MSKALQMKRNGTLFTALFFIALTLLGLLTAADYGQPWDEPWEQDILRMNGNQYRAALHIPGVTETTSTMVAPASYQIADSVEKDHGECAYYPLLWLVDDTGIPEAARMVIWHAYTWLLFMVGALSLWFVCRRLGLNRVFSGAAVLFLMLSPRFFAEGHYNNKDIVLFSLTLLTLWQALRLMEKPGFWRAALFSLAGAAATNMKIIGLPIWGLCALMVLVSQLFGRRMTARVWGVAAFTLFSFALFYAQLTPALWADPYGYLRYTLSNALHFSRWQNSVLFRGTVFHTKTERLPWYYLPYMILVTTPLWLLTLIGIGQVFAVGRLLRLRGKLFTDNGAIGLLLCTLLWALPMLYTLITQPVLYNGWRHEYYLYGPMLAMAAYGASTFWSKMRARTSRHVIRMRYAGAALLAMMMAFTGVQEVLAHPNQYAYYNAFLLNKNVPAYLELDYWNVSVLQTLRALLNKLPAQGSATIAGGELWSQTGLESAWKLLPEADQARLHIVSYQDASADYVLANTTYAVLGDWKAVEGLQAVAVTESFGIPLCTVYARGAAESGTV
jgi:hypothetical protein